MGKVFGVRNLKMTLKNKPVLWYLRFQFLSTCDLTSVEKYVRSDR